ncbi:MAG: GNAT family N-acetyltransferase [Clostridiales bacterium]|nr:GNAT family N-acetyltransferase [Clostridiales bacterium]
MQLSMDLFSQLPTLITPRLTLRPVRMSDASDLYEYSKDPEVARHVLWDAHRSIHQTRAYVRFLLRQYRTGAPSTFVIVLSENQKVIGTIGFMWAQPENRSAEVGYSLSREYWNRGIMTEALRCILEFGFQKLGLNRIEAQHECDNPASGKVMLNVGMKHEGTLRQRLYNKGRFSDIQLYAILREDFKKSGLVSHRAD